MMIVKLLFSGVLILAIAAPAFSQSGVPELRPGVGVDSRGGSVVDPTKNVGDLVQSLKDTLKEFRTSDRDLFEAKVKAISDLNEHRSASDRELLKAATDRLDSEAKLRAEFAEKINATEKDRVNAIRTVDTGAVAIANERATATASNLAKQVQDTALVLSAQVTKSADDLRTLVKTTADEQSRNLQQQFAGIQTQFTSISSRLTALEQAGAEGIGRQKFQDPALTALVAEVQKISRAQTDATGAGRGSGEIIAILGAAFMGLMLFAGVLIAGKPIRRLKFIRARCAGLF